VALACLLFGAAEALQIAVQASGAHLPGWAVQMLPYVATLVALALRRGPRREPEEGL
jgi:simple sugar transport system permease protein